MEEFSNQVSWRFQNLEKLGWIELVHPAKFEERRKATSQDQKALIRCVQDLYPFAVADIGAGKLATQRRASRSQAWKTEMNLRQRQEMKSILTL